MTIPVSLAKVSEKNDKYQKLKDDELMVLIGEKRDGIALTTLYERYKDSLGRFLLRGMRDKHLLEEVYNDVMMTVWNRASSFRGDSKVSTWVFAIGYRARSASFRKEDKHTRTSTDELPVEMGYETDSTLEETINDAMLDL